LHFDSAKPVIFVEEVTVGRESQLAGRELVLPPGTHHVELRFDSISLASSEKIRFQYRMDDVDPLWLEADNSLTAVYTNIPVGTHAFKIRACNSDGVWDRSGISFPVTQKPYFYQTAWFSLVAVTAFVVILTGAYRFRLHQIRAQINARLDERVLERTRVARELHDTLLQSFQGVLLKFYGLSVMLADRPEAQQKLEGLVEEARQAVGEGRDAVQGLRSSTVVTNELAQAIRALGAQLSATHSNGNAPECVVTVEGGIRELAPIVRDDVYRIAAEAVRNASQHAGARRIEVEICYEARQFRLRVKDDGKGIDPKLLDSGSRAGHYGLPGMSERAKMLGGKLEVRSKMDCGTEVELTIPTSRAYAKLRSPRRLPFLRKGA
jgi:signal transduction histidine kinase